MLGLTEVLKLLVRVTVWAALVVATVCAAKVSVVGANVNGRADVPLEPVTKPYCANSCNPTGMSNWCVMSRKNALSCARKDGTRL
jgi:hypothetical protein